MRVRSLRNSRNLQQAWPLSSRVPSLAPATVSLTPYTSDETRDPQRRWTEGARVDRATIADVPYVKLEGVTPERFVAAAI